jgi:hypothetical protein
MSWVTIIWSMSASVSFTLATIYLMIWFRERRSWAYLCFFVLAVGVIGLAAGEFAAMRASSPAEYGTAVRWSHFAFGFVVLGSLGFMHFYFGTGKWWLLGAALGLRLLAQLRSYLNQRIAFYQADDEKEVQQINTRTATLENELWFATRAPAAAQPNPVTALVVSGMNDVLNSQEYAQFGFWNRIPKGSWALMLAIALACNLLIGYGSRSVTAGTRLLPILPLLVSIAFMLIADID